MTPPEEKRPQNSALLQVRISRDLRDEFMRQVKDEDDSASRLVRQWIRQYIKANSQEDLFNT
ncbi:MAG: hypothetical protein GKR92_07275 [Gammaproteobacteria bacterium]|jgi:hypothetical protein|nr:MAG: hypothetical protein GKR92_07275 [Gammaproteobacteria bacterium]